MGEVFSTRVLDTPEIQLEISYGRGSGSKFRSFSRPNTKVQDLQLSLPKLFNSSKVLQFRYSIDSITYDGGCYLAMPQIREHHDSAAVARSHS